MDPYDSKIYHMDPYGRFEIHMDPYGIVSKAVRGKSWQILQGMPIR